MARNNAMPEVNAGSMADIAFLLLIFFLVTATIETDAGIDRKIPYDDGSEATFKKKNLFEVSLNRNNELFVKDKLVVIPQLKDMAAAFIDNAADGSCAYCKGDNNVESSDNPQKAIIWLKSDRQAKYSTYLTVQNEISAAYNMLRNRESNTLYGISYQEMENQYYDVNTTVSEKVLLKNQIEHIRSLYPQKLIEADLKNSNETL